MKKEFIIERQGKSFVLYAGLLDMAHGRGLKSISTEIIQAPTEANNRIAICKATACFLQDDVERTFTGIGDAAPNNVAPAMQTCILRMAETRAKARALRDAVNIGVTAFEELGEEDIRDGAAEIRQAASVRERRAERAPRQRDAVERVVEPVTTETDSEITSAQVNAIRSLCKAQSLDPDEVAAEQHGGVSLDGLTHDQAVSVIRYLNAHSRNGRSRSTALPA